MEADSSKGKKTLIQIPSYREVFSGSAATTSSYNPPPPPRSAPAPAPQSFSQAFSDLKNTDFYTPPPPKPAHQSQAPAAPPPPAAASCSTAAAQNRNAILVSHRQKGNPLLKHIRNVKWVFADIVCDYLIGQNSCALYLRSW